MRWPFGPPHLTLKPSQKNQQKNKKTKKTTKNKKNQTKKRNKEGLGPSEVALRATSPDPQTLQKKHKNKQTNQKTKKKTKKKKKEKTKKQQKYQKIAFQLSVKFFLFLGGFSKFPFFTSWPKKLNPKNTIKIGVLGPFFLKSCCASRNGHFWTKKPKIYKFQLSFFLPIFFSFNNK